MNVKAVAAIVLLLSSQGGNAKTAQTNADEAVAVILAEEKLGMSGGILHFVEVDMAGLKRGSRKFAFSKNLWSGRLKTSDKNQRVLGENSSFDVAHSRFSIATRLAGDFALVQYSYMAPASGGAKACIAEGNPVFRFKTDVANLITAEMLPDQGKSFPAFFLPKLPDHRKSDPVKDAQAVLNERQGASLPVVKAEIIGMVQFLDEKGQLAPCGKGLKLIHVR